MIDADIREETQGPVSFTLPFVGAGGIQKLLNRVMLTLLRSDGILAPYIYGTASIQAVDELLLLEASSEVSRIIKRNTPAALPDSEKLDSVYLRLSDIDVTSAVLNCQIKSRAGVTDKFKTDIGA